MKIRRFWPTQWSLDQTDSFLTMKSGFWNNPCSKVQNRHYRFLDWKWPPPLPPPLEPFQKFICFGTLTRPLRWRHSILGVPGLTCGPGGLAIPWGGGSGKNHCGAWIQVQRRFLCILWGFEGWDHVWSGMEYFRNPHICQADWHIFKSEMKKWKKYFLKVVGYTK